MSCQEWLWISNFGGAPYITVLGDYMFLIRIYAVYHRSRPALFILLSLWLVEIVLLITLVILPPNPADTSPGCLDVYYQDVRWTSIIC
ncbi:hypothetical protein OBBRIDRAFT_92229 [Obba rivulosa]|uniref:Uncharacterized protein n=1 Tax=Obba rivulosa TaxID=1052685 RepID=A0A8E2AZI3_9APHY|nr:hypothetical protein OBBRIDRAFT_92229 [Obba rivulosa]